MNETLIGQQLPVAIITTYVIEWLKHQPWFPFAKVHMSWLNRITAAIAALVTAGAVQYQYGADGSFAITGNIYTVAHVVWSGVEQYAYQHIIYRIAIDPPLTVLKSQVDPPDINLQIARGKEVDL